MNECMNYLYVNDATGEVFYCQANNRHNADLIAQDNFESPKFIRVDSDETAEAMGCDTYTE